MHRNNYIPFSSLGATSGEPQVQGGRMLWPLQPASQRHKKKRIRDHLWPPRSSMAPLHPPQGPKTHPSMLTGTVWRPCARKRPGIVPDWRPALPPHLPIGLAAGTELNGKHCQQPGQPSWGVTRLWAGVGAAAGVTGCLSSTGLTTWSELESLDWWG